MLVGLLGSACGGDQNAEEVPLTTAAAEEAGSEESTPATEAVQEGAVESDDGVDASVGEGTQGTHVSQGESTESAAPNTTVVEPEQEPPVDEGASPEGNENSRADQGESTESTVPDALVVEPEQEPAEEGVSFTPAIAFTRSFGGTIWLMDAVPRRQIHVMDRHERCHPRATDEVEDFELVADVEMVGGLVEDQDSSLLPSDKG